MAINKKGKNRVELNGQEFLWWVFQDIYRENYLVKIVCSDQSFHIIYWLRPNSKRICWIERECKREILLTTSLQFANDKGIITKSGVINILKWCKNNKHHIHYIGTKNRALELNTQQKVALLREFQAKIA